MSKSANRPACQRDRVQQREALAARKRRIRESLCCPHCGEPLSKWEVPDSPFNEWPGEFQYICFNDACCYFEGGWATMKAQGSFGSYRFMYEPSTQGCHPVAVLDSTMLRDGIVETGEPT